MASKRAIRRKMCGNKQRVEREHLHGVAHWYRKQYADALIVSYKCPFCKHFHFGHPNRKMRQAMEMF